MRRASPTVKGSRAGLPLLAAGLLACAARGEPVAPRQEPPAPDLVVRSERFELHANAWIELYTSIVDGGAGGSSRAADEDAIARLRRCHDERCARSTLADTPSGGAFAAALSEYMQNTWIARATTARGSIERATPLLAHENALVDALSRDLAIAPSEVPVRIDVIAHEGSARAHLGVLDAHGACFRGDAILGCALVAWAHARAADSELARGLGAADPEHAARLWDAVVLHAVAVRVKEIAGRGPAMSRALVDVEPDLARWLAREWPKRRAGEDAKAFAKRFAEEAIWE